jgi:hypothetical protein
MYSDTSENVGGTYLIVRLSKDAVQFLENKENTIKVIGSLF